MGVEGVGHAAVRLCGGLDVIDASGDHRCDVETFTDSGGKTVSAPQLTAGHCAQGERIPCRLAVDDPVRDGKTSSGLRWSCRSTQRKLPPQPTRALVYGVDIVAQVLQVGGATVEDRR